MNKFVLASIVVVSIGLCASLVQAKEKTASWLHKAGNVVSRTGSGAAKKAGQLGASKKVAGHIAKIGRPASLLHRTADKLQGQKRDYAVRNQ